MEIENGNARTIGAISRVFDAFSSVGCPLLCEISNLAVDIALYSETTRSTISALNAYRASNNAVFGIVSKGFIAFAIVFSTIPGIMQNIENGASTKEIIMDATVDTAISAGTIYAAGKIGTIVGTYTCPGIGTAVGFCVGLFLGWIADKIR